MLVNTNGTTSFLTSFAILTSDSNLGTFTADYNSGSVRLRFTPLLTGTNVIKLKYTDILA